VLGVASIVAAVAQTPVYSVNAVGYINVTVPKGYSMIANQLIATDSSVKALFPSVPGGTTIYKFDNSKNSFVPNQYDADFAEWGDPAMTLTPGEGAFVLNPANDPFTVTFVGEVPQGDVSINVPAGYSIVSSKVPQAGTLSSLNYTPAGNDQVFRFDNAKGQYTPYSYDPDFQEWSLGEPSVNVGESFFLFKKAAGMWTRSFSVN
jgi:hypothetical protein